VSGYAEDSATGETCCYDCAYDREVADMRDSTTWVGYLMYSTGGPDYVTNWTGRRIARIPSNPTITEGYTPTGGWYVRHSFQAIDVHGHRWICTSPGHGMYVRMRRAKTNKTGEK
jgi:hypothetical protein